MSDVASTERSDESLYPTPADKESFSFFEGYVQDLMKIGRDAIEQCHAPTDGFALLCIDPCEHWEELIDLIDTGDDDTEPGDNVPDYVIAAIIQREELEEFLTKHWPNGKEALLSQPAPGKARLLIFSTDGRVMVQDIDMYAPLMQ